MTKLFECYVAHPTYDEAVEIVERLIANGADAYDVVEGMAFDGDGGRYYHDDYEYWGYNSERGTYTESTDSDWVKRSKQLTMQEFRDAFPCDKYDSPAEEWPQPGDKVVVNFSGEWEATFIGKSPSGAYVCQMPDNYPHGAYEGVHKSYISKPKSDREKFIEAAVETVVNSMDAPPNVDELRKIKAMMNALYDADFKAPEDK